MNDKELREKLNSPQYQAASTIEGNLLVLAGAGAGKTRVITYRTAYMLSEGIPQNKILCLTFTNKAAREMQKRIKTLTNRVLKSLTVCTFHSFGVRVLKEEYKAAGYSKNFSIYDEQDKTSLIKSCIKELGAEEISDKTREEFLAAAYKIGKIIAKIKTGRQEISELGEVYNRIYLLYTSALRLYNSVDFEDLITLPIKIFTENDKIRKKYQERFPYIMVDEFQDTSALQYRLLTLLGQENVMVVGDDDQSIYSWRGAVYKNIERFEKEFYPKVIKLEENYRSTSTILEASNALISNNTERKGKRLWTKKVVDDKIKLYYAEDEYDEAEFVASEIKRIKAKDKEVKYSDFGVLYRVNKQSRPIEEELVSLNIPYVISGGLSIYDKEEIKTILSYLKLIGNHNDDIDLLKVINIPKRSIGRTSIEVLNNKARKESVPLFSAIKLVIEEEETREERANKEFITNFALTNTVEKSKRVKSLLTTSSLEGLKEFVATVESARVKMLKDTDLSHSVAELLKSIAYSKYLENEYKEKDKLLKYKERNIAYFLNSIRLWQKEAREDGTGSSFFDYLSHISLVTQEERKKEEGEGAVSLMSIHKAKGLEFNTVFIVGLEEGYLPHKKSFEIEEEDEEEYIEEDRQGFGGVSESDRGEGFYSKSAKEERRKIEEERRLFYVALTRAKTSLYLSLCQGRHKGAFRKKELEEELGEEESKDKNAILNKILTERVKERGRLPLVVAEPSRFLSELPANLVSQYFPPKQVSGEEATSYFSDILTYLKEMED